MNEIKLIGKTLDTMLMTKNDLKGVPVDARTTYRFYRASFNGLYFCLLESIEEENHASIDNLKLSERLKNIVSLPIVFLFNSLQFVERNRLIDRGVYFIVSDKYAYLPFLVINSKSNTSSHSPKKLSSVAQYILLYHLQKYNLNGLSMTEIENKTPFKYVTISRAVKNLLELQLCKTITDKDRVKRIYFEGAAKEIWDRSLRYLQSPVRHKVYCDNIISDKPLTMGNVNALAKYSSLNPDGTTTYALNVRSIKELQEKYNIIGPNDTDGTICIELWNYPPLNQDYVDPLSLYLSLKDDKDPRIEKELETMINKLW